MGRGISRVLVLFLGGCAGPEPDPPEKVARFLHLMESTDHHVNLLEDEEKPERIRRRLSSIRENITLARGVTPTRFGKGIDPYFERFLAELGEIEASPWEGKPSFQRLLNGCTQCHERYKE